MRPEQGLAMQSGLMRILVEDLNFCQGIAGGAGEFFWRRQGQKRCQA